MFRKIIVLLAVTLMVYSCSKTKETPEELKDNFDRGAMLTNYAQKNIIPAFVNFNAELKKLKSKAEAFTTNPTTSSLEDARVIWLKAYKAWQHVAKFNLGKAEELQFVYHFNVYPVNVTDVEDNISSGTYDLNHPNNHDAQGFPALDYLLNGLGTDTEIIAKFSTDANANKYKLYVLAILTKMIDVNKSILDDWKGGYASTFSNSTDNTATSSLNKLVNDFIYYYEKQLRANKVGIPVGNFSPIPLPEKVEAYYKKTVSKELLIEALDSFQDFFEGKSFDGKSTGKSFKSYLEYLKRNDLATAITNQLDKARTSINNLDDNFYQQIKSDKVKMTKTYDELQKAVVLLKVDMLQAFNVSVDYVDADGD